MVRRDKVTFHKQDGGLGLRSAKNINLAFLTKLGWRIFEEENALWVQVLKTKYLKKGEVPRDWKAKMGCSNAWRGIVDATHVLDNASKSVPRNGRATKF